jgi:hypothetical protein
MLTKILAVDEMMADIMDAQRMLIVEDAVDEYLLAEKDILTEATTAADKMADLEIDSGYDDESQFLEDDEEVNEFIDAVITDDIAGEDDLFQDTLDDCDFYDDDEVIEDVEDVLCPYDDIEALMDDEDIDIDSLIDGDIDVNY